MGTKFRFALGFGLGLILSGCAISLNGAGHGTMAPMIANLSFLVLIPGLGFLLALVGTPFLWAIYFVLIPELDYMLNRIIALVLIGLLHIVPGVWLAAEDTGYARTVETSPAVVLAHSFVLVSAIIFLTVLTLLEIRSPKEDFYT